jgi:predicted MFS family arabinose efflux permease
MLRKTFNLYRNAYSNLPRPIWFLALIMLINRSGAMVIPFLSVYLSQDLNFEIAQVGWVLSTFGIGSVVGAYVGGALLNKVGHYYLQIVSLILNGLCFLVLLHLRDFWSVVVGIFLTSLVADAFRPANFAAIAHYSRPESRTRAYALNRLAMNLGFSVGPALGGILAFYSYAWLFWVDGLTCILAAFVFLFTVSKEESKSQNINPENPSAMDTSAYRDFWFLIFIVFTTLNAICFFQFFQTFPLFLKTQLKWSETLIGFALALNGVIIVFFEMVIVYRLEGYNYPLRLIMIGTLLIGFSYGILNIGAFGLIAWLMIIFITFGEIMTLPFMNTFVVGRSTPQNRGEYSAIYTMAYSIAHIFSSLIGTQVINLWGFFTLWFLIPVICIFNAWGFKQVELALQKNEKVAIKS